MPNMFQNLSFEVENPLLQGHPAFWEQTSVSNGQRQALYTGTGGVDFKPPFEAFEESWQNDDSIFEYDDPGTQLEAASYDSLLLDALDFEDFEKGWDNNQAYEFELSSIVAAEVNGRAFIDSNISGTYDLPNGITHSITTDLGTASTEPFIGEVAEFTTTSYTDPTQFAGSETIVITIGPSENPVTRTVIFSIADQLPIDVINRINSVIDPVGLKIGEVFADGLELRFEGLLKGTNSFLLIEGDPIVMGILGLASFPPQGVFGTGNVPDLSQVTGLEVINVINGIGLQSIGVGITSGATTDVIRFTRTQRETGTIELDSPASALSTALGLTVGVTVGPTGIVAEAVTDYESEWNNTGFDFEIGATDPGIGVQTFEPGTGWASDGYIFELLFGVERAEYYNETRDFEDFEDVAIPEDFIMIVNNPPTTIMTINGHGLQIDDRVAFLNSGGRLPEGLVDSPVQPGDGGKITYPYQVKGASPTDIEIKAHPTGASIVIDGFGAGTHFLMKDTNLFWTTQLSI